MGRIIEIKKISELPEFNSRKFHLDPKAWNLDTEYYFDRMKVKDYQRAREMSQEVDDICIAIVHDTKCSDYTFASPRCQGKATIFVLFNAEECDKDSAEVVGIISYADPTSQEVMVYLRYAPGKIY